MEYLRFSLLVLPMAIWLVECIVFHLSSIPTSNKCIGHYSNAVGPRNSIYSEAGEKPCKRLGGVGGGNVILLTLYIDDHSP